MVGITSIAVRARASRSFSRNTPSCGSTVGHPAGKIFTGFQPGVSGPGVSGTGVEFRGDGQESEGQTPMGRRLFGRPSSGMSLDTHARRHELRASASLSWGLCHRLTFQKIAPYPPLMIEMEAYSLLRCELPPVIECSSMPRGPRRHRGNDAQAPSTKIE